MADFQFRWTPPALHQLDRLAKSSPRVIGAIIEFCYGRLLENPQRVGHALQRELVGRYSARVGPYRAVYWIHEKEGVVYIDRVDHRGDIYRPR